jgi:hypothetical protein
MWSPWHTEGRSSQLRRSAEERSMKLRRLWMGLSIPCKIEKLSIEQTHMGTGMASHTKCEENP